MQIVEGIGEFGLRVTCGTGLASTTRDLSSMRLASWTGELSRLGIANSTGELCRLGIANSTSELCSRLGVLYNAIN
ncbi:hypothetical protein HKD37_02G005509 [Glycine soja]